MFTTYKVHLSLCFDFFYFLLLPRSHVLSPSQLRQSIRDSVVLGVPLSAVGHLGHLGRRNPSPGLGTEDGISLLEHTSTLRQTAGGSAQAVSEEGQEAEGQITAAVADAEGEGEVSSCVGLSLSTGLGVCGMQWIRVFFSFFGVNFQSFHLLGRPGT